MKTIFAKKSDVNVWDTIKVWDISWYKIPKTKEFYLENESRSVRIRKNVFENMTTELIEDKWDTRFYKVISI